MPTDHTALLLRFVGGDPAAAALVRALAATTDCASVLVAAALLTGDARHLDRATEVAVDARERRLVVLARVHLDGDAALLDALARDHLADHPDHLLAAWVAGRPGLAPTTQPQDQSRNQP